MTTLSGRRFLSLPTVEPHGITSATPLLRTLIAVSGDISAFRPEHFPVHRNPASDAIRLVRLLRPSLQNLPSSPAAIPTLLEIYVSFQKLLLLLHDLSRRGARLISLLRSDTVAHEFRSFARTFAFGLDLLPLANGEPAEAIRLTARQARREKNYADPTDDRAIRIARSSLDSFRNGVPPDRQAVRILLQHLGVHNWSSCNDEVSFLEEELKLSNSNGGGKDTAFLSSLLALALYSRSVCCDAPELRKQAGETSPVSGKPPLSTFNCLNLQELRCPISLDLMTDPVTVSTGQTYDRSSIVRWLKDGNITCPVTGEKLANTKLIPNLALVNVIRQYCLSKNISLPESLGTKHPNRSRTFLSSSLENPTASQAMQMLAGFLVEKLRHGDDDERRRGVYEIHLFARSGTHHRSRLVDSGATPQLLHLLGSSNHQVQEHAMAALLHLAKDPDGRRAVVDSGGIVPILDVLGGGATADGRHNAAAVLFYLSNINEYRVSIGENPGAIAALVRLLRSSSARGKRNAAAALLGLLGYSGNRQRVVAAGAIPVLAGIVSKGDREDILLDTLAVLATVADGEEGAAEVLRSGDAVQSMADMLRSSASLAVKEWCVSILLCLCNHGGRKAIGCLYGLPALIPSLYSQLTEGTQRASKKASSLIGILHRSSEVQNRRAAWFRQEEAEIRLP